MLLNRTDMLDEGMSCFGLRGHRQHGLIESVHQLVYLAEQQSADTAPPRACPDATTRPQKPRIVFLVGRTGSAERGSNGARNLGALHRHPAPDFDHRVGRQDFPPGLGVIEDGFVRPALACNGAPCFVKCSPQLIAGSMRIEWDDADAHRFVSGFRAKRALMSKVTASG
jgi:hypothetical protein